jgi:hypothetical protein
MGDSRQVTSDAMAHSLLKNLMVMAGAGTSSYDDEEFGDNASELREIYYEGDDSEDFDAFRRDFESHFVDQAYGKTRPDTGDRYADELAYQKYKCVAFMKCCGGRAATLARTNYEQLLQAEADTPHGHEDPPPTKFFESFVRSIKSALGPVDALVYWILQGQQLELRSMTAEGFEELMADLLAFLQRLISAKTDVLKNLAFQVKEGRLSGLDSSNGGVGGAYEVNAIRRQGATATPIPRAVFRQRKGRTVGPRFTAAQRGVLRQREAVHESEKAQMQELQKALSAALRQSTAEREAGTRATDALDQQNDELMDRLAVAEGNEQNQASELISLRQEVLRLRRLKSSEQEEKHEEPGPDPVVREVNAVLGERLERQRGEDTTGRGRDLIGADGDDRATAPAIAGLRPPLESDFAAMARRRFQTQVRPATTPLSDTSSSGAVRELGGEMAALTVVEGENFTDDSSPNGSLYVLEARTRTAHQTGSPSTSAAVGTAPLAGPGIRQLNRIPFAHSEIVGKGASRSFEKSAPRSFGEKVRHAVSAEGDSSPVQTGSYPTPVDYDPFSLWNLDEGEANVLVLEEEEGEDNEDEEVKDELRGGGADEQLELLQQYVDERLLSTKAERKLVSVLGGCGLSVQQPPQDPTLADFDISDAYVIALISHAVRRYDSVKGVVKFARPRTPISALAMVCRTIYVTQTSAYRRKAQASARKAMAKGGPGREELTLERRNHAEKTSERTRAVQCKERTGLPRLNRHPLGVVLLAAPLIVGIYVSPV